jgi:hypothetical protein
MISGADRRAVVRVLAVLASDGDLSQRVQFFAERLGETLTDEPFASADEPFASAAAVPDA